MIDDQSAPIQPARATLKLKSSPSPSRKEVAKPAPSPDPAPAPALKRSTSPKATWSEPFIRQMQAEMDELAGR